MDFAGFCDEAVRAFLLKAGMPYFFVFLYSHFCFLYGKQIINGVADRETCCCYLKLWCGNSRVQAGAGACCSVVLNHSSTHKII